MTTIWKSKILLGILILLLGFGCAPQDRSQFGDKCEGNTCSNNPADDNVPESVVHDIPTDTTPVESPLDEDFAQPEEPSDETVVRPIDRYAHLDPENRVPEVPLTQAIEYFDQNKARFKNQNYIVVIDYTKRSTTKRFFLIDLRTGEVEEHLVAHGRGSDSDHDGYATRFTNIQDSQTTSIGFFKTAETYNGSNGYSLRLDGLSTTNSNARARAIVIHGADYVGPGFNPIGRSWGCPALEQKHNRSVIDRIKGGAMIYSYFNQP